MSYLMSAAAARVESNTVVQENEEIAVATFDARLALVVSEINKAISQGLYEVVLETTKRFFCSSLRFRLAEADYELTVTPINSCSKEKHPVVLVGCASTDFIRVTINWS